jgi:glycosyltransferase involved in cell wall biosynthesis
MKKTKIIIASVLKPIDDTRMFEKFGLSMSKTNKYDVHIIGFISKNTLANDSITFYPHGPFGRTSIQRLITPLRILKIYIKVKPDIIICNTHELLIVTILNKILFGGKIVYDIRENYFKNIRNTPVFHPVVKPLLAGYVRFKELITKPFFDHFILAERVYQKQLKFIPKDKSVVVENKHAAIHPEQNISQNRGEKITLLYSGTISESNGVFDAIKITDELKSLDKWIHLKIIGFCALKVDLIRLKETIANKDYIELIGGDYLVPHHQIVNEIMSANFGFVLKKLNQGINDDKLLTRLFEYSANQLPMLILNNPTWMDFCEEFNAGIALDPDAYDPKALLYAMKKGGFYTKGNVSTSLWQSEEVKLLQMLDALIS